MVKDNRNCIAFKLNYCNGGSDNERIGYTGICSKSVIDYNIKKAKRVWCKSDYCNCKKYIDGDISYEELKNTKPCWESSLLIDWQASACADERSRESRQIAKLDDLIGHLCLLTTVKPNDSEKNRIVFAIFIIGRTYINEYDSNFVIADKKYRLEFKPNEAYKAKYWSIHKNPKNPIAKKWGTGVFRYFNNDEALQFLKMAVEIKKGTSEEKFAKEFLNYYCKINNIQR